MTAGREHEYMWFEVETRWEPIGVNSVIEHFSSLGSNSFLNICKAWNKYISIVPYSVALYSCVFQIDVSYNVLKLRLSVFLDCVSLRLCPQTVCVRLYSQTVFSDSDCMCPFSWTACASDCVLRFRLYVSVRVLGLLVPRIVFSDSDYVRLSVVLRYRGRCRTLVTSRGRLRWPSTCSTADRT